MLRSSSQLTINTAIVYMHRFYMHHSFTKFSRYVSTILLHYFIVCFYPLLKVDKMKTMISLSFKLEKPPPPGSLPCLLWSGLRYWVICTLLLMSLFLLDVDFHFLPKITQVIHRLTQENKHGEMTATYQLSVWAWCSLHILGLTGTSYRPLR